MSCIQYALADYENIRSDYSLPVDVRNIIVALSKQFGCSMSVEKKQRDRMSSPFDTPVDSTSYKTAFKATVIEKKVGVELWMNEIRISLNKMSDKNYEVHSNLIIAKMTEIQGDPEGGEESLRKIASSIFDIASTNKFFSEIYARLYKLLIGVFPELFTVILWDCVAGYTGKMKEIQYVDQNTNYDDFCAYNKENDKRKATTVFITNLVKYEVLTYATIGSLICQIQELIDGFMVEEGKINEVDEIVENLFLLLTSDIAILKNTYGEIDCEIQKISKMKARELPSLSSRCIFKYMDMAEKIRKLEL